MNCTDCQQRDACDLAGKDDPLLTGCDASHGTWAFDRLRLDRMTADRDALRAEVEALRHEVELTNEHEHQILTHPLAKQIAVGIVAQYWGELDPNDPKTPGKIEGLTIDVREDGQGVSVENAVSDILEAISRWPAR